MANTSKVDGYNLQDIRTRLAAQLKRAMDDITDCSNERLLQIIGEGKDYTIHVLHPLLDKVAIQLKTSVSVARGTWEFEEDL